MNTWISWIILNAIVKNPANQSDYWINLQASKIDLLKVQQSHCVEYTDLYQSQRIKYLIAQCRMFQVRCSRSCLPTWSWAAQRHWIFVTTMTCTICSNIVNPVPVAILNTKMCFLFLDLVADDTCCYTQHQNVLFCVLFLLLLQMRDVVFWLLSNTWLQK